MKTSLSPPTRVATETKRHTYKISREQRSQAYVEAPLEATRQMHESTPRQMVQILRKLSFPLSLDALQNWRFAPPVESITVSLVVRLRRIDDEEAEFLLASVSTYPAPNPITSKIRYFGPEKQTELVLPVVVTTEDGQSFPLSALLDSGCTHSVFSRSFAHKAQMTLKPLPVPRQSYNADGSENTAGVITHYVTLRLDVQDHSELRHFYVIDLVNQDLFLGYDWLRQHNPEIDWKTNTLSLSCIDQCAAAANKLPSLNFFHLFFRGLSMELARAENTKKEEVKLPDWLSDFRDVFEPQGFDELPPHRASLDHAINLKPDVPPFSPMKVYPMSGPQKDALRTFLDENLATGRIRPSKSQYAAPFFFVPKQDGKERPVQDYRWINKWTIPDKYPLPRIDTLIDSLRGSRIFSKMDIRWGFNNVRIREGDEHKAAFITEFGLFEPLVMFFGLCNSPPTFQRLMDHTFADFLLEAWLRIYMDDKIVHHQDQKKHREDIRRLLQRCRENKLFFRLSKCEFETSEVHLLGLLVSENSVQMDPTKTAALRDWPVPKKKKDLQSFLGFANFYRRFIYDFAEVALPLNRLTGDVPWEWTSECQVAFDMIKTRIASNEVLAMPTSDGQWRIECDASYYATGAVLSQQQPDQTWRPVAFQSWTMSPAQRNYQIYDKELLAVINSIDEWRPYLLGATESIEVFTDHKNLEFYRKPQDLTRRQAGWISQLQEFHLTLIHRPGRLNAQADFLSRPPNIDKGLTDNQQVVGLPDTMFRALTVENIEVIQQHHDTPMAGHPGITKTIESVQRQGREWPTLSQDVCEYILACPQCQMNKPHRYRKKAPLHPVDPGQIPFANISVDLVGPLPKSDDKDMVLVIVDKTTKRVSFVPTIRTLNAEGYAKLLVDHWIRFFGVPSTITSDRGPQFVADFIKGFYAICGIKGTPSTAYHPQTDGQSERAIQELEIYLRYFINDEQDDWVNWIALAEYAYNDKPSSSTGITPHFATLGLHPSKGFPPTPHDPDRDPLGSAFANKMSEIRQKAHDNLVAAQETYKRAYDRKKGKSWKFSEGDLVWLESTNLTPAQGIKKLSQKRYGPFPITKQVGPSSFQLRLPRAWSRVFPVFNEILLTPYRPPVTKDQRIAHRPPPEIIDDVEEYDVDYIVDKKIMRGRTFYKVRWKGYSPYDDSWEPEANLTHAQDVIADFNATHPSRPLRSRFSSSASSPHIILAISPTWASAIRDGSKTCEFRKYMLPPDVRFAWLYETGPVFGISTVVELDSLRLPGQIIGPGVGNDDFNAGTKASHFAYPVLSTHRLPRLVSSSELTSDFSVSIPHRWCPAPSSLPRAFPGLLPF